MVYFSGEFFSFYQELAENNNKAWFHSQKKRFQKVVKEPFESLVTDIIRDMQNAGDLIDITAKDCILRFNRDVRFSADKSPYNLHSTAFISRSGRKDKSIPGFFIRISAEDVGLMGGCVRPSAQQLKLIRDHIAANSSELMDLLADTRFKKVYGELQGDRAVRLPAEYKSIAENIPLIANKQYYFTCRQTKAMITKPDLKERLIDCWQVCRPVNNFFLNALLVN